MDDTERQKWDDEKKKHSGLRDERLLKGKGVLSNKENSTRSDFFCDVGSRLHGGRARGRITKAEESQNTLPVFTLKTSVPRPEKHSEEGKGTGESGGGRKGRDFLSKGEGGYLTETVQGKKHSDPSKGRHEGGGGKNNLWLLLRTRQLPGKEGESSDEHLRQ